MGRSTKYSDDIVEKAKYWARDGCTDEEIAKKLNIGLRTLYTWLNKYPHFKQALKENKEIVDYQVENALLKRALGFEYEETEMVASKDGKTTRVKKIKKIMPPDTTAAIFWLKNRQPLKWRDKKVDNLEVNQDSIDGYIEATAVDENQVKELFKDDVDVEEKETD